MNYSALLIGIALLAIVGLVYADDTPQAWPTGQACQTVTSSATFSWNAMWYVESANLGKEVLLTMNHTHAFDPDLYARFDAAPTRQQYDYADFTVASPVTMDIIPTTAQTSQRLYFGVFVFSGTGSFQVCLQNFQCLNQNCGAANNAGVCTASTGHCSCNTGFSGDYCNIVTRSATFDNQMSVQVSTSRTASLRYSPEELSPHASMQFHIARSQVGAQLQVLSRRGALPTDDTYDEQITIASYVTTGTLTVSSHKYAPGDWYIAVRSLTANAGLVTVNVTGSLYLCPQNCGGHGSCDATTGTCTCESGWDALPDCSYFAQYINMGQNVSLSTPGYGVSHAHFNVSQHIFQRNVDVILHYDTAESCETTHTCPIVYINYGDSQWTTASAAQFLATSAIPSVGSQRLYLSDHALKSGVYQVTIQNPSASSVIGALRLSHIGHCPNDCSGHGDCSSFGICACHDGHWSSDCSITAHVCQSLWPAEGEYKSYWIGVGIAAAVAAGIALGPILFRFIAATHRSAVSAAAGDLDGSINGDNQYAELN